MTTWQTLQCLGISGKYVFHASTVVPKGSDPTHYDGDLSERFLNTPLSNWVSKE